LKNQMKVEKNNKRESAHCCTTQLSNRYSQSLKKNESITNRIEN
jgi:hypothetical protein